MRRSRLLAGPAALLLALAACGDDEGTSTAPAVTAATDTVADETVGTGTPTDSAPRTTSGTAAATAEPTGDPASAPPDERCVSPLGYSVVVPNGWVTNTGDVAPPCSYLDPEPFTVPEATDVRPAAISVFVDPVPFDEVSAERSPQTQRDETTLAGQDAVRVEAVEDGSNLYPDGTRRTAWYVDLPPSSGEDGPRTLVANVVAIPGDDIDLDAAAAVLDRMMGSLQLEPVTASTP